MPRRLKRVQRRVNLFIDAEAGVNGNASADKYTDDENNNLYGIMIDDVK